MSSKYTLKDWQQTQHFTKMKLVGSEYKGPCPACGGDDRFFISANGVFGSRCDCDFKTIIEAAGLPQKRQPTERYKCTRKYIYNNTIGEQFEIRRLEHPTKPKKFTGIKASNGPFWPWCHDQMIADHPIIIVEGEETARKVNQTFNKPVCTTTQGGCERWHETDFSCFNGRDLILWPDFDEPGYKMMLGIANLMGTVCNIKYVHPPKNSPKGWDAADADPDTITKLISNASKSPSEPALPYPDFEPISVPEIIQIQDDILENVLEVGAVSMLFGKPGTAKSTLALLESVAVATGMEILLASKHKINQCKVGLLWCEESLPRLQAKMKAITDYFQIDTTIIQENMFHLTGPKGGKWPGMLQDEQCQDFILERMIKHEIKVLVVDHLALASPGIEESNTDSANLMSQLNHICQEINGSIQILHHARKSAGGEEATGLDEARAASAITGGVRIARQMTSHWDDDNQSKYFTCSWQKNSNFETPESMSWIVDGCDVPGVNKSVPLMIPMPKVDPFSGYTTEEAYQALDTALADESPDKRRLDKRSDGWIMYAVAEHLKIDVKRDDFDSILGRMWKQFQQAKYFKTKSEKCGDRKIRKCCVKK